MTPPSDSIEALVEKIGSCMATLQPSRQLDQEASEALTALADRVREAERERDESREGLVSVFNHEGEYVGCLGTETWQWTLDGGIGKLKERAEAAEARVEVGRDLVKELEAEAKALREALRPFVEHHAWAKGKFIKTKPPALGPKEIAAARAALAASESSDG